MNEKITKLDNCNFGVGLCIASTHAITLISLVITIILLIILAGIGINLSLGENGLFNKAEQAKERYIEAAAKEKLENTLAYAFVERETNKDYNNQDFLDNILNSENMEVIDNNVIVDNFNFQIDRDKLIIVESLGKTQVKLAKKIQEYLGKNENSKYMVRTLITIQSNIDIESITVLNELGNILEDMKFEITTDKKISESTINIELDTKYIVKVKTKDSKETLRTLIEKSQENIRNLEELVTFRDRVNSGLTYEGKTINLVETLDLSNVCGENLNGNTISFEPIGNSENQFKGIFDGNSNSIKNIFINKETDINALFGYIKDSEVKNLTLDGGSISNGDRTGGICGIAENSSITKCINNAEVEGGKLWTGGIISTGKNVKIEQCANLNTIVGTRAVGGIAGFIESNSQIINSFNIGKISTKNSGSISTDYSAGGICGGTVAENGYTSKVINCYNTGEIYGKMDTSGIIGYHQRGGVHIVSNCYSSGVLTGNGIYAISGFFTSYMGTPTINLSNNYWLTGCGTTSGSYLSGNKNTIPKSDNELKLLTPTLGENYIEDGKKIDKYGNITDNFDENGNIKYINNGYPVLKWQVQF